MLGMFGSMSKIKMIFGGTIVIAIVAGASYLYYSYKQMEERIETQQETIVSLSQDLQTIRESNNSLERELERRKDDFDRLKRLYDEQQEQIKNRKQELDDVRERINNQDRAYELLSNPRARELVLSKINDFIKCWSRNYNKSDGECVNGEWKSDNEDKEN